ncbi:helix-turn-helix domain-containing protein [Lysinibacillus sp. NPDC094403]|uniref:helix-turn-helix domain-containing protein n=1 Tax=Lysinibacillus sp. NPDC094403 TaxID=3390581 RepID=UPI003D078DFF
MKISSTDLQYICQLIYETHNLSVFYINQFEEIAFEYTSKHFQQSSHFSSLKDHIRAYPFHTTPHDFPIFFSNNDFNFFYINLKMDQQFLGSIIVGPSLSSEMSDDKIYFYDGDQPIPFLHYQQFLSISLFVYYLIYREKLNKSMVIHNNQELKPIITQEENSILELSNARRNFSVHTNLYYEKILLDYVKNGRKEKLNELINYSIVGETELGVLSKQSHIRSVQNLMITGIALICRAAIEGGLNEETAFTLSDFYIQKLEDQGNLLSILSLMEEAIYDFTDRVSKSNKDKYSATITTCQHYIDNHIYREVTLDQLAEICHLSPNYLSSLFKKEVGISISEYIQQQRIDEAKRLLTFTNYPISDIGSLLNFTDQSYFIKIFKKFTGTTPKQYRIEHSIKR